MARVRDDELYTIVDPDRLADAVTNLVREIGPTQNAAAARCGISPPVLNQLANGKKSRVSHHVIEGIADVLRDLSRAWALGPHMLEQLYSSLEGARSMSDVDAHREWCAERATRFVRRPSSGRLHPHNLNRIMIEHSSTERFAEQMTLEIPGVRGWRGIKVKTRSVVEVQRVEELGALLSHLRTEVPRAWSRIEELRAAEADAQRFAAVLMRVAEPLLESPESGFGEVGWRDLDRRGLERFVYTAVANELILIEARHARRMRGLYDVRRVRPTPAHGKRDASDG